MLKETEQPESDEIRLSNPRQRAFLTAFARVGRVKHAAALARTDRSNHFRWLKADAEYADAFDLARRDYVDELNKEVDRRAVTGTLAPIFQGGKHVGDKRVYSDRLLMFRLRALDPDSYADRRSGPATATRNQRNVLVHPSKRADLERWSRLLADPEEDPNGSPACPETPGCQPRPSSDPD